MYYTYIVECSDGTYYTGYTNDLRQRIRTHNEKKGAKYTRSRTPVTLVYAEESDTKSLARGRDQEALPEGEGTTDRGRQRAAYEFFMMTVDTMSAACSQVSRHFSMPS